MTFNGNRIHLPKLVTIKLRDKFKITHMMKREPLLFHNILRQHFSWFTFACSNPPVETVQVNIDTFPE